MLRWNPTDVLACLEVLPQVDGDETSFLYAVSRDGIRLELSVHPNEREIFLQLYREGIDCPIFSALLKKCLGIHYVNDQRGEYLEVAPGNDYRGCWQDAGVPLQYGFRVAVKPSISVTLFGPTGPGPQL